MNAISLVILALALQAAAPSASGPAPAAPCAAGARCADSSMDLTLPDAQTAPAANVRLVHFWYTLPGDAPGSAANYDDMIKLEDRVKKVAASTLAHSEASYGVRIRYVLRGDQPAEFHMQVTQAPPGEAARLKQFFTGASALKEFHAAHGVVLMDMEYNVVPAGSRP